MVRVIGGCAYSLLSFLPAIPVLLGLMLVLVGDEPSWHISYSRYWNVFAAVLLIAVATADSIISGIPSVRQMLLNMIWIVALLAIVTKVVQAPNGAYVLGILYFIHSWRAFPLLWCGDGRSWWLWTAWIRDCIMAILLFLGPVVLSEAL